MDVEQAWDLIHDWTDRHAPEMRRHLNGPADPTGLDDLERVIGYRLPEDFRVSYLIHDGSAVLPGRPYRVCRCVAGLPLLPLQRIRKEWKLWAAVAADEDLLEEMNPDYTAHPAGAVKAAYADRGWVPFAGEENHYLALDFSPEPQGAVGQVINFGRDDFYRCRVAATFGDFMSVLAGLFAEGELIPNPDTPLSLVLKRTGKDLLRSLPDLFNGRD